MDKVYCKKTLKLPSGTPYIEGNYYNVESIEPSLMKKVNGNIYRINTGTKEGDCSFVDSDEDHTLYLYEYFETIEETRERKLKQLDA
jgi:hypothetical protein